jgi:hypothetical protein
MQRQRRLLPPLPGVTVDLGQLYVTQFDGSRYANSNCTMAAAAMLFEVQTGRSVSGARLRRWSRARQQATGLREIRRAFRSVGERAWIGEDVQWRSFVRRVRSGRSAVVLGWYGRLPQRYVLQPGYVGAHGVFVLGYSSHALGGRGGFYVMDPLGSGAYDGKWWTGPALRRYGWGGRRNVVGAGPQAYFGNVAFQADGTAKRVGARGDRPVFRSYWATTKALLQRARSVTVQPRHQRIGPGLRGASLRLHDPRLRMRPRRAARHDRLRWPLSRGGQAVTTHRKRPGRLDLRAPAGTRVVSSAPGRVLFRTWPDASGLEQVWVQHGPSLYTLYAGLHDVRVVPGQWVGRGTVLGRLAARMSDGAPSPGKQHEERKKGGKRERGAQHRRAADRHGRRPDLAQPMGLLRFSVVTARQPWSQVGHADPRRFLKARPRGHR